MTQLLEQALNKVRTLPDEKQDVIASLILEQCADAKWDQAFAES